jgi:hypothetical protein
VPLEGQGIEVSAQHHWQGGARGEGMQQALLAQEAFRCPAQQVRLRRLQEGR